MAQNHWQYRIPMFRKIYIGQPPAQWVVGKKGHFAGGVGTERVKDAGSKFDDYSI